MLWLWYRPADLALIRPLAWEPPSATSVALKKRKKEGRKEGGRKEGGREGRKEEKERKKEIIT